MPPTRLPRLPPQEWAQRLQGLAPSCPGPIHFLWGTDWEDAPLANAQGLQQALPERMRCDWRALARATPAAGSLHAFFGRRQARQQQQQQQGGQQEEQQEQGGQQQGGQHGAAGGSQHGAPEGTGQAGAAAGQLQAGRPAGGRGKPSLGQRSAPAAGTLHAFFGRQQARQAAAAGGEGGGAEAAPRKRPFADADATAQQQKRPAAS
jgi:hypothetical protein